MGGATAKHEVSGKLCIPLEGKLLLFPTPVGGEICSAARSDLVELDTLTVESIDIALLCAQFISVVQRQKAHIGTEGFSHVGVIDVRDPMQAGALQSGGMRKPMKAFAISSGGVLAKFAPLDPICFWLSSEGPSDSPVRRQLSLRFSRTVMALRCPDPPSI